MYKRILLIACTLLIPAQVLAIAPKDRDIRFTVHNLSYNTDANLGITDADRQISADNPEANQVCIFCHTPHNASPAAPLWNKYVDPEANPGGLNAYRMYTSSKTLTTVARGASITEGSDSMLCLSCHDGKTAINVIHNSSIGGTASADGVVIEMNGFSTPFSIGVFGIGINYTSDLGATRKSDGTTLDAFAGYNLADDHPIGFSYTAAQALKPTALHNLPTATTKVNGFGVRFFGPDNRMECGSCHDPHIYYGYGKQGGSRVLLTTATATDPQKARSPFLVRDNIGSGLCLSCHIK